MAPRSASSAPGVQIEVEPPESHDSFFFMAAHANQAAAEPGTCATCHTETYCVSCHDGPADGGYHPPSFVAQHSADAWGRDAECATCHNAAAFCREALALPCYEGMPSEHVDGVLDALGTCL